MIKEVLSIFVLFFVLSVLFTHQASAETISDTKETFVFNDLNNYTIQYFREMPEGFSEMTITLDVLFSSFSSISWDLGVLLKGEFIIGDSLEETYIDSTEPLQVEYDYGIEVDTTTNLTIDFSIEPLGIDSANGGGSSIQLSFSTIIESSNILVYTWLNLIHDRDPVELVLYSLVFIMSFFGLGVFVQNQQLMNRMKENSTGDEQFEMTRFRKLIPLFLFVPAVLLTLMIVFRIITFFV